MSVLLAIPVLDRPHRARLLADAVEEGTTVPHVTMFVCSPGDTAEIAACNAEAARRPGVVLSVVVPWRNQPGDYARKINHAFAVAAQEGHEWVFTGADDLCFCPGWAETAIQCGATFGAAVVGTNDLGNPRVIQGGHSTHSLVRTEYVTTVGGIADEGPGRLYHEGYSHVFCDDEMVRTALARRTFTACRYSEVPHLHPDWGHGERDATYHQGQQGFWQDHRLFESRRPLWEQRPHPIVRLTYAA